MTEKSYAISAFGRETSISRHSIVRTSWGISRQVRSLHSSIPSPTIHSQFFGTIDLLGHPYYPPRAHSHRKCQWSDLNCKMTEVDGTVWPKNPCRHCFASIHSMHSIFHGFRCPESHVYGQGAHGGLQEIPKTTGPTCAFICR
jgi:hypothetical protein